MVHTEDYGVKDAKASGRTIQRSVSMDSSRSTAVTSTNFLIHAKWHFMDPDQLQGQGVH